MSGGMARAAWFGIALVAVGLRPAPAETGGWAERMFSELGHNFGPVPRGAVVRHNFVMTNRYAESLTILNVRASCGCTSGRASATTVAPGQSVNIEAQMDTRNFVGRKATKLTLTFLTASGKSAEVQLAVVSEILPDIVLNPGTMDFGAVSKGQAPTLTMTIERVGAPGWKFERMIASPRILKAVDARLDEVERSAARVVYRLTVSLKTGVAAGYLRDEIRILTNDPSSPNVPVMVTAQVRGTLSATPSLLALGRASAAGATGRYLVRSSRPFAIKSIEGAGDGFTLTADDDKTKLLHVVTVKYDRAAGSTLGDLRRSFRLVTDLADEAPIELNCSLRVDP